MLKRYSDASFVLSLPFEMGFELYMKATEKNNEDRVWEQWLVDYTRMDKNNFVPFSKYLEGMKVTDVSTTRTDEEIIEDAENILKSFKRSE